MSILDSFFKKVDSPKQITYSEVTRYEKKILVVEDEEMISKALAYKLQQEGFRVAVAENGQKGLEMIYRDIPDVVLLDINMPVMDGITMMRTLRANPQYKNLPIIILSNDGSYVNMRETQMYNGAIDFIVKSNIDLDQIVSRISNFLLKKE